MFKMETFLGPEKDPIFYGLKWQT